MVPHDLEGVLALYREVFGHAYAERFEARYSWAHRDNLYPHNSPKWVVADGDRIVGFLAAMPLPYTIAGQRV
ncbi:MAG: GNAT family N-acetyltransferase, partial [Chloroflexi bacterium]|nr:GNAT family N-acetyltransferase [Chloroflexota bacterium]